jgi:hypothetical protein
MPGSFGIAVVVVAILACAGIGFYVIRRAKGRKGEREAPATEGAGRLAVVESTVVDGERRLLLVRCDNIEHLILVGGPADLVVENDVHRNRFGGRIPSRPLGGALSGLRAQASQDEADASEHPPAAGALEPRPIEARRPSETQPPGAAQPRLTLAPAPAPASVGNGRNGAAPAVAAPTRTEPAAPILRAPAEKPRRQEPAATKPDDSGEARGARLRLQASEPHFGRRDNGAAPTRRTLHIQESAVAGSQAEAPLRAAPPATEAHVSSRTASGPAGLPAADGPWPEPDSVESEIVRALRVTPNPPLAPNGAHRAADSSVSSKKAATDPATTLGDLAERLEEALAREVRSAGEARSRLDLDLDAFAFESEKPSADPKKTAPATAKLESATAKPEPAPSKAAKPASEPAKAAAPASEPAKAAPAAPASAKAPAVPSKAAAPAPAKAAPASAKAAASEPAKAPSGLAPAAGKTAAPAPEPARPSVAEPAKIAGAGSGPERPRESRAPAERQGEAPVVSLDPRRREPTDPLEDEMARLLGELAGETKQ